MKPLNESLYAALKSKFGKVTITSTGVGAKYKVVEDFESVATPSKPKKISVLSWGETYSVNCLRCRDKRSRLYISHIWGTKCEEANRRVYSCVKCHNEACNWSDLWDVLYLNGYKPSDIKLEALKPLIDSATRKMELPGDVEDLIPINQLPCDHPVLQYLQTRGFRDIQTLATEYQFCYCQRSPWKKSIRDSIGKWHTVTPEARLIIPNVQLGAWQGWMARYIGEIPKDATTGKPIIQKYLNAPGYSFGASLYRLEEARKFTEGKFCVVCEGALSAIACGFAGVCTFGMYPKPMQEELLLKTFSTGRIVFMVEAEAAANGRIYECIDRLKTKVADGCVAVELPKGADPATIPGPELLKMIERKCREIK